jgi:hypothetical protein
MPKDASRKGLKWKILGVLTLGCLMALAVFITRIEPLVQPQTVVLNSAPPVPQQVIGQPPAFSTLAPAASPAQAPVQQP